MIENLKFAVIVETRPELCKPPASAEWLCGSRIQATTENLRGCDVQMIAQCHCTGFRATFCLQNGFGDRVAELRTGLSLRVCQS